MSSDDFPWVPFLVAGAIISYLSGRSDEKESPGKTRRELELEQQHRDEWARRRAQAKKERQEHQDEIVRQAEEAREDGYVVCTSCLPERLTIICKACNSDGEEICDDCKRRQEEYEEEQRRISDD